MLDFYKNIDLHEICIRKWNRQIEATEWIVDCVIFGDRYRHNDWYYLKLVMVLWMRSDELAKAIIKPIIGVNITR